MDWVSRNFLIDVWLSTGLLTLMILSFAESKSWVDNVEPWRKIAAEDLQENSKSFRSPQSVDYFHVLSSDDNKFVIGAQNAIYEIILPDLRGQQVADASPVPNAVTSCRMKGQNESLCHNYVRLLIQKSEGVMMACGTGSFSPICQTFKRNSGDSKYEKMNDTGEDWPWGVIPFGPMLSGDAAVVGDEVFAATTKDLQGVKPQLYRWSTKPECLSPKDKDKCTVTPLRTPEPGSDYFRQPTFVSVVDHGEYVYVFYRELSMEKSNCDVQLVSRVARVCKNDQGPDPRNNQLKKNS